MTVNPSTMRLGIASILIGLVGAYGVRVMMEEEEAPPAEVTVEDFLVPLASQDLPTGRLLKLGDISLRKMDVAKMKEESMPLELVMMSADQIIGRRLRKPIRLGEPFLTTSVYLQGGEPKYEVKPGYRAVSIAVSIGRGGYAEAGDVVDVYFTSHAKAADDRTGQRMIPTKTISVVDAVTVLEATRPELTAMQAVTGYRSQEASFLVQVLPDQAAKFQALQGNGDFGFMIRSEGDISLAAKGSQEGLTLEDLLGLKDEPPPPQQPYWQTEYYRGGGRSAQHFPIAVPTPEQMAEYQRLQAEHAAKTAGTGGDEAVADASPVDDRPVAPAPARRRPTPTLREPMLPAGSPGTASETQVPYRVSEPAASTPMPPTSTPLPPSPAIPATDSATDDANPFGDDAVP